RATASGSSPTECCTRRWAVPRATARSSRTGRRSSRSTAAPLFTPPIPISSYPASSSGSRHRRRDRRSSLPGDGFVTERSVERGRPVLVARAPGPDGAARLERVAALLDAARRPGLVELLELRRDGHDPVLVTSAPGDTTL